MLTYERVFEVFSAFLAEDQDREVLKTKRGYITVCWESKMKRYDFLNTNLTPEQLVEDLADDYEEFEHYKLTGGRRDATPEEEAVIAEKVSLLKEKCLIDPEEGLSFERVETFLAPYIEEWDYEIATVKHGKMVLRWAEISGEYETEAFCRTPLELLDDLLGLYAIDYVFKRTQGNREGTEAEFAAGKLEAQKLRAECLQETVV